MEEIPQTEVQELGHLGLLASLNQRFQLKARFNQLLPKSSNNQKITHGEAILAMIYQGLGFGDGRLYFAEEYFSNKPLDILFGKSFKPKMFNDDVLGRALDAITDYGPSQFFKNVTFPLVFQNNLMGKFLHLDTTTHNLWGRKYDEKKRVQVKFGHSKGRADLPQIVQCLMTTSKGLPLWSKCHSGNQADKNIFLTTIASMENFLKQLNREMEVAYVADSALYTKKILNNQQFDCKWITRVPESIKIAKQTVEQDNSNVSWVQINENYKFHEIQVRYGKSHQRWAIVVCRRSKYKEQLTFENNFNKEKERLTKRAVALMKKVYPTKGEIFSEVKKLKKSHPHFKIEFQIMQNFRRGKGTRPKVSKGHRLYLSFEPNEELIQRIKNKKGKFIVASNILDSQELSTISLVEQYLGRISNIERCFKTLKDSSLKINKIFLKRTDRIEALMSVMSLCLFVHNLGQLVLRQGLSKTVKTMKNQAGRETPRPTLKWAFQAMQKVLRVRVDVGYQVFEEYKGIEGLQRRIIGCFGSYALHIYGFT